MQLVTEKHDVSGANLGETRQFTVKLGAHIMQVLSGLYTNPVNAMVREYLTNMYDAYVALRKVHGADAKIQPPVIHVPTNLAPYLEFRDYGIGMSRETVMSVYSQYGNSTKNDANDEVGGFGLGSKTAFCYQSGAPWSIESRWNGERHLFTAYINGDSMPTLSHVMTEPTDEHNGVTIKIPIRRQDIPECVDSVKEYAPYFPMELKLEGIPADQVNPIEYALRGPKWGVRASRDQYSSDSRVVMGNVPYTIDRNTMYTVVNNADPSGFLWHNSVDLHLDIGTVDIVPSRDSLKYTDKTKNAIRDACLTVLKEIPAAVSAAIQGCATEWDALCEIHKMHSVNRIANMIGTLTFKGKKIDPKVGVTVSLADVQKKHRGAEVMTYELVNERSSVITVGANTSLRVRPEHTFLVVNDLPNTAILVAKSLLFKELVNKNSKGRAERWGGHKIGHVHVVKGVTKQQLADLFPGYPVAKVLSVSELKGTVPLVKALSVKDTVYRWAPTSANRWEARAKIPTGGTVYYYLPLVQDPNTNRWASESEAYSVRQLAHKLGMVGVTDVYGLKPDRVKDFDPAVWVNLAEAVTVAFKKWVLAHRDDLAYRHWTITMNRAWSNMLKGVKHPMVDAVKAAVKQYETHAGALSEWAHIMQNRYCLPKLDIDATLKATVTYRDDEVEKAKRALLDKYPMLHYVVGEAVGYYEPSVNWGMVEDYMTMVDKITP